MSDKKFSPEEEELIAQKMEELRKEHEAKKVQPKYATLTYKQLAKNYENLGGKKCYHEVIKTLKNVNGASRASGQQQVRMVNRPGSIIKDGDQTIIITRNGKSLFI